MEKLREVETILAEPFVVGTRVTNCVIHASRDLAARPDDCRLCLTDLRNQFTLAVRVNEFLNDLKDKALGAIRG